MCWSACRPCLPSASMSCCLTNGDRLGHLPEQNRCIQNGLAERIRGRRSNTSQNEFRPNWPSLLLKSKLDQRCTKRRQCPRGPCLLHCSRCRFAAARRRTRHAAPRRSTTDGALAVVAWARLRGLPQRTRRHGTKVARMDAPWMCAHPADMMSCSGRTN